MMYSFSSPEIPSEMQQGILHSCQCRGEAVDNHNKPKQVMETARTAFIHSLTYYLLHSASGRITPATAWKEE